MLLRVLFIVAFVVVSVVSEDLFCFSCKDTDTDEECNRGPRQLQNCTAVGGSRCKITTKLGGVFDKGCATENDCLSSTFLTQIVGTVCCDTYLCNENTTWPAAETIAIKILENIVGMKPANFFVQITTYQSLYIVLYALALTYIIRNVPRDGRSKSPKVSPDTEETIELQE
ncbi:uncharacterized protein LOC120332871 [Styela clava]|uniref:uncharacterized protein LOC120332871 n=1 Tax=Styela clava TaxID=7725 RepID=UPI001939CC90|nr:uncharacterized protein LOC120332871 [Styela clava]